MPAITRDQFLAAYATGKRRFRGLNFRDVDLSHVQAPGADFKGSAFYDANLTCSDFHGASFSKCVMKRARLWGSNFDHARFDAADLTTADFRQALARAASFKKARLRGANLRLSDFTRARLDKADFRDFTEVVPARWPEKEATRTRHATNVEGAIWSGAILTGARAFTADAAQATLSPAAAVTGRVTPWYSLADVLLPEKGGVFEIGDPRGEVLLIGSANNLRARVKELVANAGPPLREATQYRFFVTPAWGYREMERQEEYKRTHGGRLPPAMTWTPPAAPAGAAPPGADGALSPTVAVAPTASATAAPKADAGSSGVAGETKEEKKKRLLEEARKRREAAKG
ncbi:MAG: pentapeptide repeat-containing protein [Planctomycetes bacterium]|nr:pentapeptide repeat-containing protein [Planctomycetota bacterium]